MRSGSGVFTLGLRLAFLLGIIVGLGADVAWAHGGGTPQLTNEEAGPYWVSVWTQPEPLQVGQAHITVAVSQPTASGAARREAGPPVLNANVQVQLQPLDSEAQTLTVMATHEGAANKLFYEADLELAATGQWEVVVAIAGPEGVGSASFEAQVSPRQRSGWPRIGGLSVMALAAAWVVQKFRGRRSGV